MGRIPVNMLDWTVPVTKEYSGALEYSSEDTQEAELALDLPVGKIIRAEFWISDLSAQGSEEVEISLFTKSSKRGEFLAERTVAYLVRNDFVGDPGAGVWGFIMNTVDELSAQDLIRVVGGSEENLRLTEVDEVGPEITFENVTLEDHYAASEWTSRVIEMNSITFENLDSPQQNKLYLRVVLIGGSSTLTISYKIRIAP